MPLISESYLRSLKMQEAEEIFDLLVYRPVAYLLVRFLRYTRITPNQVTLLSLAAGLTAAWQFSLGTVPALMAGAGWYLLSNILDCADGQLARLQQSGTPFGRLLDGITDYISGIAIFIGIGTGLSLRGDPAWWLVVFAGISSAIHAILFDHYQGEYIATVRGEDGFLKQAMAGKNDSGNGIRPIVSLYLRYLRLQEKFSLRRSHHVYDRTGYRQENQRVIRLWSFLGPTTNRTLLIISAFAGHPEWYLCIIITAGNLYMLYMLLLQRAAFRRLHCTAVSGGGE